MSWLLPRILSAPQGESSTRTSAMGYAERPNLTPGYAVTQALFNQLEIFYEAELK